MPYLGVATSGPRFPSRRGGGRRHQFYAAALTWLAWIAARSSPTTGSRCASASRCPRRRRRRGRLNRLNSRRSTSQYYRMFSARGRWQVRRLVPPCLVRQDGERDGLLGIGIDAVIGGGGDVDAGQEGGDVGHDLRIVGAAAAGDQVGGPGDRALHGTLYTPVGGGSGEYGGGGDHIAQRRAGLLEARDKLDAVLLAPGALRRLVPVVGVTQ